MFDIEEELDTQTNNLNTLSASVTGHIATFDTFSGTVDTAINTTIPNAITEAKNAAIASASAYTDSKIKTVNDAIDGIDNRVVELEKISGATQTAVQTVSVKNTETNKITSTKTGTNVELNFDEMIIDCGEF
jgi:prefoldin subunit 5